MNKYLLYIALIFSPLIARENPFVPVDTSISASTITKDSIEDFDNVKVNLPSSARILKSIELNYQNLDGSIESKKVDIDKKIDWHDTLILKKYNTNEVMIKTKSKIPTQKMKEQKQVINFKDIISFEIKSNQIQIKTKDKKLRDFMVANPYKIVLDFKKELSFYTKIYKLNLKKFKSIAIGKHSGYYRVAIELDGQYIYKIKKSDEGYLITLE
ncbi:AMIN domain-containing protein [Sulfurospirillum sp. 1307]